MRWHLCQLSQRVVSGKRRLGAGDDDVVVCRRGSARNERPADVDLLRLPLAQRVRYPRTAHRVQRPIRKHHSFLSCPYVCPEPVLVKC